MSEKTVFENDRISNLGSTLTLTLDRVILHTVMHHSSTSTYIPNFVEIKETFLRPTLLLGRLGGVDLKLGNVTQPWLNRHLASFMHHNHVVNL